MASSTYTFSVKPAPLNPDTWFAGIVNDGDRNAMTGAVGSGIQTEDASATPVTSPLTISTTAVTHLVVPQNAVSMVINVSNASPVNISEVSAMTSYYQIQQIDGNVEIDLARQNDIYLMASSATATAWFYFKIV